VLRVAADDELVAGPGKPYVEPFPRAIAVA